MELKLSGIEVDCVIGDLADERHRLQRLMIDAVLTIDEIASMSDQLEDTVDYAALTEKIRTALIEAKCRMIERAAKVVHSVCVAEAHVKSAQVSVTKFAAVPHLKSAAVTLM